MKGKGKIYLLIGYLGSGKTTFIRNLLTNKTGQKYAVIQNQFTQGQMGIQQPLIMDESGVPFSNFLQLPNGCICCSAKNDLIAGVQYILQNTDVKNIVVQTNGLADPAQAIKQFWFDQKMQIKAQLHSIITIIPVPRFNILQQNSLFHRQIVYANKVLLTFIDKSNIQQIQIVQNAIVQENSQCFIARNDNYNVLEFLAGDNMFSLEFFTKQNGKQQHKHQHQHQHEHNMNSKHKGIISYCIKGQTSHTNKNQLECAVGQLLWQSQMKILRIKGVVCLNDNENAYQLQGIDDLFELKLTKTSKNKFNNNTIMLIIGQKLNQEQLNKIFKIK